MLLRCRSSLFFAVVASFSLLILLRNHEKIVSHVVEQYRGSEVGMEGGKVPNLEEAPTIQIIDPLAIEFPTLQDDLSPPPPNRPVTETQLIGITKVSSRITVHLSMQTAEATSASFSATSTTASTLQEEFMKENKILGQ